MPDKKLLVKLDGRDICTTENITILDLARKNGVIIPTLCYLEGLTPVGICRLCLVEVKGISRLLPACTTKVDDGMEIITASERLNLYRKMILQLIFAERNHVCSVCVSNKHCELQSLSVTLGITHINYPYRFPKLWVDSSHPRFVIDHNRCILCSRCVRVCGEIEGVHTWDIMWRGINGRVITDMNQPWGTSKTCTSCSKCVNVCPTGALAEKNKSAGEMIKKKEFLSYLSSMRREWR